MASELEEIVDVVVGVLEDMYPKATVIVGDTRQCDFRVSTVNGSVVIHPKDGWRVTKVATSIMEDRVEENINRQEISRNEYMETGESVWFDVKETAPTTNDEQED